MVNKNFKYNNRKRRKNKKRKFNEKKEVHNPRNNSYGVGTYILAFGLFIISIKIFESYFN
jgi:hypothetical protein